MPQRTRVASVECIRFFAAACMMLYHFTAAYAGGPLIHFAYLFIDFLFMLSGFHMMMHLSQRLDSLPPATYILCEAAFFYPIYIVAFCLQFLLFVLLHRLGSATAVGQSLYHFKWEIFLLQSAVLNARFSADYLLAQAWYRSAMLLALCFAYPLARALKKWFLLLACPLSILLFYPYALQALGTLNLTSEAIGLTTAALLRAFAGICLGSLCYAAYAHFRCKPIRRRRAAALLELFCYASLIGLPFFLAREARGVFFVPVFALLIVLGYLGQTPVSHFLNTHGLKAFLYLGSLSLYLYLLHWTVMSALQFYAPDLPPAIATPLFFAITLLLSALVKRWNERRKSALPVAVLCALLLLFAFALPGLGA